MQDKTINNALIALCRRHDMQADLAERILYLRGVRVPKFTDRPFKRGQLKRLTLSLLPCDTRTLTDEILRLRPGMEHTVAAKRAYKAFVRLEEAGLVGREGRVWRLAP